MAIPSKYIDKFTDQDTGESRMVSPAADMVRVENENFEGESLDEVLDEVAQAIEDAGSGGYTPPQGGIPATDLAPAVQTSLGKADTAYQKPASGIPANDIAPGVIPDISGKANAADVYDKITADGRYVQKETGKGLSTNDYTNADKTKLAGISAGAEVNVIDGIIVGNTEVQPVNKKVTIPAGQDGKSAYQSYLDTTEDADPLSEEEWVASLHGEDGISVDSDDVVVVHNLNGNPADLQQGQVATLGADMGKTLGDWAKGAMYLGGASGGDEEPAEPEDEEVHFVTGEVIKGVRLSSQTGGISSIITNGNRATTSKIYYIGEGEVPSGMEAFDLSKLKSFTTPNEYYASPTCVESPTTKGTPTAYLANNDWQTGTYTFTENDKLSAVGKPYLIWNFKKGVNGTASIGDNEVAKIISDFVMTMEGDPVIPVEPPLTTNKVISVVNAAGQEVMAMSSPVSDQQVTEVYSKAAVDSLIAGSGGGSASATTKIRVATWNFGHFALGASTSSAITQANYDAKLQAWAKAINGLCATILCATEYEPVFETHKVNGEDVNAYTNDVLMSLYYAANSVGAKDGYNCNGIFGKLALANGATVNFSNSAHRYYQKATVTIGGKTITIVCAHLEMPSYDQDQTGQINQLITDMAALDYVIICGDFNIERGSESKYQAFVNAGYKLANCGDMGGICTWPATGITGASTPYPYKRLDNIAVKGFDINNVTIYDDGTLTDHCAIFADLTLI